MPTIEVQEKKSHRGGAYILALHLPSLHPAPFLWGPPTLPPPFRGVVGGMIEDAAPKGGGNEGRGGRQIFPEDAGEVFPQKKKGMVFFL
jgi:hypothetical protein